MNDNDLHKIKIENVIHIDRHLNKARTFINELRKELEINAACLDNWGGAIRIVYDTPHVEQCGSDCAKCALFDKVGKDPPDTKPQDFVTTLVKANELHLKTFPAKQVCLNCKTFDQYLETFISWLVENCKKESEIQDELTLIKHFRIVYFKDISDLIAKEIESKQLIVEEYLKRAGLTKEMTNTVRGIAKQLSIL